MNRYRVVRDLEGGTFGMFRDYTLTEWRKQALEWCLMDDNYGLGKHFLKVSKHKLLDEISNFWSVVFRKVRKDKKQFKKETSPTIKEFKEWFTEVD